MSVPRGEGGWEHEVACTDFRAGNCWLSSLTCSLVIAGQAFGYLDEDVAAVEMKCIVG